MEEYEWHIDQCDRDCEAEDLQSRLAQAEAERDRLRACHEAELGVCLEHCAEYQDVKAEREGWKDAAAQYLRNSDFYQGIVRRIGERFGVAARTSDDGSVQDDVLALKVPVLVIDLLGENVALERALRDAADTLDGYDWESVCGELQGVVGSVIDSCRAALGEGEK